MPASLSNFETVQFLGNSASFMDTLSLKTGWHGKCYKNASGGDDATTYHYKNEIPH